MICKVLIINDINADENRSPVRINENQKAEHLVQMNKYDIIKVNRFKNLFLNDNEDINSPMNPNRSFTTYTMIKISNKLISDSNCV